MADDAAPRPQLDMVKKLADEKGCYMQLFVAYNPETEMILLASNAPDAENGEEAALLLALAAQTHTERHVPAAKDKTVN